MGEDEPQSKAEGGEGKGRGENGCFLVRGQGRV
jgi:hypothetical protein